MSLKGLANLGKSLLTNDPAAMLDKELNKAGDSPIKKAFATAQQLAGSGNGLDTAINMIGGKDKLKVGIDKLNNPLIRMALKPLCKKFGGSIEQLDQVVATLTGKPSTTSPTTFTKPVNKDLGAIKDRLAKLR